MADQLYIRVRGRVQGPFDQERLRALVRRGTFGRLHEVSEDGANWVRASTYPELFVSKKSDDDTAVAVIEEADEFVLRDPVATGHTNAQSGGWFYLVGNQQFGPLERMELARLISAGQLSLHTQVWAKGMPGWLPATEATELGLGHLAHTTSAAQASEDVVTEKTYGALIGTRPWVLLFAIIAFVMTATTGFGGLFSLFMGIKRSDEVMAGQAIGMLIQSGIICWLGFTLLRYSARIQALRFSRSFVHLEEALQAQHEFWRLIGVISVVVMAITLLVAIWVMAAV